MYYKHSKELIVNEVLTLVTILGYIFPYICHIAIRSQHFDFLVEKVHVFVTWVKITSSRCSLKQMLSSVLYLYCNPLPQACALKRLIFAAFFLDIECLVNDRTK